MTGAQKRFCDEYLIDLNATRAYKVAYPRCKKDETARTNSSRLLTYANIQQYINTRQKELSEKVEITQERVLQELAKLAFLDIRKIYDNNGAVKDIQELDESTAGAISSIETVEQFETVLGVKVKTGETKKVKFNDKSKALELLAKHLGLFNDKMEVNLKYEDYVKQVEDDEEY